MSLIISVEGNIGSGKSSFVKYFEKYIKENTCGNDFKFIQEPVDEWNNIQDSTGESILEKFYANQEEYAFSFQIMAYITRLRKLIHTIETSPDSIYICERSLETDKYVFAKMLYDSGKIREIDWVIYNYWFNTFSDKIKTNLVVYINTNPVICYERIKSRGRAGEESIPLEYLENCHKYHEEWLENKTDIITLNGNVNFKENIDSYNNVLESTFNNLETYWK